MYTLLKSHTLSRLLRLTLRPQMRMRMRARMCVGGGSRPPRTGTGGSALEVALIPTTCARELNYLSSGGGESAGGMGSEEEEEGGRRTCVGGWARG